METKRIRKKTIGGNQDVNKRPRVTYEEVDEEDNDVIDTFFKDDSQLPNHSHDDEVSSKTNNSFLDTSLNIIDNINGIYKAIISSIRECQNSKICLTFNVYYYDSIYPVRLYTTPILYRRSALFRLADNLNLFEEDDINLSKFLKKEVWVSIKTNIVKDKVYENIVDFASIEYVRDELSVDDKGYFIFDD